MTSQQRVVKRTSPASARGTTGAEHRNLGIRGSGKYYFGWNCLGSAVVSRFSTLILTPEMLRYASFTS